MLQPPAACYSLLLPAVVCRYQLLLPEKVLETGTSIKGIGLRLAKTLDSKNTYPNTTINARCVRAGHALRRLNAQHGTKAPACMSERFAHTLVGVRAHAFVRACVRLCMHACMCECVRMHVQRSCSHVCLQLQLARR